eukprot:4715601-Prymnesium_polylepis.1
MSSPSGVVLATAVTGAGGPYSGVITSSPVCRGPTVMAAAEDASAAEVRRPAATSPRALSKR